MGIRLSKNESSLISHFKLLSKEPLTRSTKEQQLEWIKSYQDTEDLVEKEKYKIIIYKNYWRLILKKARIVQNLVDFDTAYMSGCIGLIKAMDKMRLDKNISKCSSFTTVAILWINHEIYNAINEEKFYVSLPCYMFVDVRQKLKKFGSEIMLKDAKNNIFTNDKTYLKNALGVLTYFQRRIPLRHEHEEEFKTSCPDDLNNDNSWDFSFQVTTFEKMDKVDIIQDVNRALDKLPEKLKMFLVKYFGLVGEKRRTLKELGDEYHLTREGVRQILLKAKKVLKNLLTDYT